MYLPNGAAEELGERAADQVREQLAAWAAHLLACVGEDLAGLAYEASRTLDHTSIAPAFYELGLQTAMLGCLDVLYEIGTGRSVAAQFAFHANSIRGVGIPGFSRMPFREAIDAFLQRKSVTRKEWDRMEEKQRHRAFTVAYQTKKHAVELVRREVHKALEDGWTVSSFRKQLDAAFKERNLSPLSEHHTQTIIRTNTAVAHGEGRKIQQTTPVVRETHPFWEYSAVLDRTTRKTHRQAHGALVRSDDPIWATAYPPCGFNCRCNVISRRKGNAKAGHLTKLVALPDKGWSRAA